MNELALALETAGNLPAAEAACREALALRRDYGEAWHNLRNVLRKQGRPVEAAEAHANAARLLPDVPVVHGALSLAPAGLRAQYLDQCRQADIALDPFPYNLTMRMSMRRFTRLTNAFSKKLDNLKHAVALHFMHYNFCRIHQTLRVTPAMEAGLANHVWELEELVALLD